MSLIMCQANNLQIPFKFSQNFHPQYVGSRDVTHHVPSEQLAITFIFIKCHPQYVGSRDVTHHVSSEQFANTFIFFKSVILSMSSHEMSFIMCQVASSTNEQLANTF